MVARADPELPKRRRKSLGSPAVERPRLYSGAAGLARLGHSLVARPLHSSYAIGVVSEWCQPWFVVAYSDGSRDSVRGHALAPMLIFSPSDFFDPALFFFDFSIFNPLRVPGWVAGLRSYLDTYGVCMPTTWLEPLAHEDRDESSPADATECFLAREREQLQGAFLELAGESRRPRTLSNLRHPALKALWWFASRRRQLPPTCGDVTDYLTFLTGKVDTTGSVADARGALGFLASVNAGTGWDKEVMLGGRAALPLEAMRRRHAHAFEKAPGLPARLVLDVLRHYALLQAGVQTERQWRLAVGVAIGCAFKLMARYADMCHVRYDDECFRVHDMYIRIYVSERKTHVYGGQWIDVARPHDGSYGVFDALLLGKRVFGRGHVMPHIDTSGRVDLDRPMGYDTYVLHLRHALATVGVPDEEARQFTAHSLRSGAATEAVHSGLHPLLICGIAGVKSMDWLVGYMRADLMDRLRASWSLGL